jgi:hypothetical protein
MTFTEEAVFAQDGVTTLATVRKRLEWVKRQIMSSPERYDQGSWTSKKNEYDNPNACNTIGCVAGWLDVKMNGFKAHFGHDNSQVISAGKEALGLDRYSEEPWLFSGDLIRSASCGSSEAAEIACTKIDDYLDEIGA